MLWHCCRPGTPRPPDCLHDLQAEAATHADAGLDTKIVTSGSFTFLCVHTLGPLGWGFSFEPGIGPSAQDADVAGPKAGCHLLAEGARSGALLRAEAFGRLKSGAAAGP